MRPAPRLHPQQSYERPDSPTDDDNREAIRQLLEERAAARGAVSEAIASWMDATAPELAR
jgi:hypothetical protein